MKTYTFTFSGRMTVDAKDEESAFKQLEAIKGINNIVLEEESEEWGQAKDGLYGDEREFDRD